MDESHRVGIGEYVCDEYKTEQDRGEQRDSNRQLSSQRLYLLPSISQAKSFIIIAV